MPIRANALAVMAKAPIPGTVKTRMAPPLTQEQAAALSRALLLDQLDHLSALREIDLYVAFTPPEAAGLIEEFVPAGFRCFPQRGGDLGERMKQALAALWWRGHRSAAIIGSDVAAVPLEFFYQAFEKLSLRGRRVVLGPSRDGGYYFVGMNRPTPEIFDDMTWSHDRVLGETTARLARLGVDFDLLPAWFDIDTVSDLESLRVSDLSVQAVMNRTVKLLQRLDLWHQNPE
jgi:rSAM/selenodomain-associated transferase 1